MEIKAIIYVESRIMFLTTKMSPEPVNIFSFMTKGNGDQR